MYDKATDAIKDALDSETTILGRLNAQREIAIALIGLCDANIIKVQKDIKRGKANCFDFLKDMNAQKAQVVEALRQTELSIERCTLRAV